jgi:hypothetical protein
MTKVNSGGTTKQTEQNAGTLTAIDEKHGARSLLVFTRVPSFLRMRELSENEKQQKHRVYWHRFYGLVPTMGSQAVKRH